MAAGTAQITAKYTGTVFTVKTPLSPTTTTTSTTISTSCSVTLVTYSSSGTCNVAGVTCGTAAGNQGAVTRASTAVCSANNLPSGTTLSNWKFTDGTNTVTTSSVSTSWSGTGVQGGTVSVTATSGATSATLSASLTVNARASWAFTSVSAAKVANGGGTGACTGILPVLTTPTSNSSYFGDSCLYQAWYTAAAQVSGGPNSSYWYVTSASNVNNGVSTIFQWERVPDLDDTSSTFYKEQTGTYNASTDPGGCISGSNLAAQTQRHESGSVAGHWGEYNNAQNASSNNLGVMAEGQVGGPSMTQDGFTTQIKNALTSAAQTIQSAESVEPYAVNYDQYGALLGYINFPTSYTSCK